MANKIIHPDGWKATKGYANGVLTNNGQLFIGGQIGWTSDQVFETHTFIDQMEQTLVNIVAIVEAAGGKINNIVRLTWYIKDKNEYINNQKNIGEVYQKIIGKHYFLKNGGSSSIDDKFLTISEYKKKNPKNKSLNN